MSMLNLALPFLKSLSHIPVQVSGLGDIPANVSTASDRQCFKLRHQVWFICSIILDQLSSIEGDLVIKTGYRLTARRLPRVITRGSQRVEKSIFLPILACSTNTYITRKAQLDNCELNLKARKIFTQMECQSTQWPCLIERGITVLVMMPSFNEPPPWDSKSVYNFVKDIT